MESRHQTGGHQDAIAQMSDKIVLQFSTSVDDLEDWASALIRRICHSPFSHVDFMLDDGTMLGASDMGELSSCIAGNPRGVAIRPPNYQKFGMRRRMEIVTSRADKILEAAKSQLGKPFDSDALHAFLSDPKVNVNADWQSTGAWFCAELAAWSFDMAKYWIPYELEWPLDRISPTDLLMLFQFDKNWSNRDIFWYPVPELVMGQGEH